MEEGLRVDTSVDDVGGLGCTEEKDEGRTKVEEVEEPAAEKEPEEETVGEEEPDVSGGCVRVTSWV